MEKINSIEFYSNYKGQLIDHLTTIHKHFTQKNENQKFIYLAGDSSLDNKYWILKERKNATNGYEQILDPPLMVPDICYHLNNEVHNGEYITLNCAIEESTLGDRSEDNLLDQDKFIRDNITKDDILIVSLGGNDVALKPSTNTINNMGLLMQNQSQMYSKDSPGIKHFIQLFHHDIQQYISNLVSKTKPKKVVVCMIYNPDQKVTNSWANTSLRLLGYDNMPSLLQNLIKTIFELATSEIKIEGTEVIPFPMFEHLDGKDTTLYVQRVEPSDKGGQKLAKAFINSLSI